MVRRVTSRFDTSATRAVAGLLDFYRRMVVAHQVCIRPHVFAFYDYNSSIYHYFKVRLAVFVMPLDITDDTFDFEQFDLSKQEKFSKFSFDVNLCTKPLRNRLENISSCCIEFDFQIMRWMVDHRYRGRDRLVHSARTMASAFRLVKKRKWPTIPQLYIDGELVGGCDITTEMFQSGELQSLLGASK